MESLQVVQEFLITFPVFPYLRFPHCILMSLALRQEYGPDARDIAKSNPLSCFIRLLEKIA